MSAAPYDQTVWYDVDRKLVGLSNRVRGLARVGHVVLIVAHFPATRDAVASVLPEQGIRLRRYAGDSSVLCGSPPEAETAWLALARDLLGGPVPMFDRTDQSSLALLVAEHHPLPGNDDAVIQAAASFPCHQITEFHTSLADPLIEHFGGNTVKGLFRSLGMDDDSPLSHPMIARSVRNAQEKIAKKVRMDIDAESAEEWFRVTMATR